jgi:putative ABC transport system permease protein
MFRYALKSLRANLTRLVATATAVVVGIGFLAAGLMLTDAMEAGLTGDVEQQYEGIDLAVVAAAPAQSDAFGLGLTVQPETLGQIRQVDGVAAAYGERTGDVRVLGPDGDATDLRTQGRVWIDDQQLSAHQLVEGEAPEGVDEVVVDEDLAEEAEVSVGDTLRLRTPVGPREATLVGISRFGDRAALDPGGTVSFSEEGATEILGSGSAGAQSAGWDQVIVRTEGDPAVVAERLRDEVPGSLTVQTRDEFIARATEQASAFIDFLRPALQGFAYLSLFVASFVIFNTFSVVVTQRFRELALIRAVGGTPAQVRRSLLVEGLGIGLGASVLGVVAGALFALGLQAMLGWFDIHLPGSGVKLSVGTVVACVVVGTLVTVLSVIVPAFRAGRTKPVEAMRAAAVDVSGTSRWRAIFGAFFLIAALVLLGVNQLVDNRWFYLAPGALSLFVGLVIGGPLLARLFARLLSWPMSTVGLTGRLAADNSMRNPKRTATTANALVIGLFLVTLVTVAGEALKTTLVAELNELSGSDYLVASDGAIDPETVAAIGSTDGVAASAPVRSAITFDEGGSPVTLSTVDFEVLEDTAGVRLSDGSLDAVRDGDAMAAADLSGLFGGGEDAQAQGLPGERVGDTHGLRDLDGEIRYLEIGATLEAELDSIILGYLVSEQTFAEMVGEQPVSVVFVRVETGQAEAVGERLEQLLVDHTGVEVAPGNFIGQAFSQIFDFLIGAVNGLLGMSVVVALVGIVNTMTLSIFERRHELGLVRALGMTRKQVGRMVRLEAVLIGLLGTVIGVGAGVLLGWVVVSSMDESIDLAFNWARVGLIVVVGLLVGVLAAILPTRRATRVDMLEAMSGE